ncbi:glycoside hydrolase family 97 protein [candidate division KSB1 bacterium]
MKIKISLLCFATAVLLLTLFCAFSYSQDHELVSPDGRIRISVSVGERICYSVFYNSIEIISSSPVSLTVKGRSTLGVNAEISDVKKRTVNVSITAVVPVKSREIIDHYNELSIKFKGNFGIDFRAYDDGVAYRFNTEFKDRIRVESEEAVFTFTSSHNVWFPTEESFLTHSERQYEYISLRTIPRDKMSCMPVLVDYRNGPKIAITESDLRDYPGMYLRGDNSTSLYGLHPGMAVRERMVRDRTVDVAERADYIADTEGIRTFPWRLIVISENDTELLENQMVFKLASPNRLEDTSWIRPGKVAWDWWNANNIYGVDFRAGINTDTYKYYIDFASKYGIEYIILDEGWSDPADLFKINPGIDMEELVRYSKEKNVGLILWVTWNSLDRRLHEALDRFEDWGIKGIKVDFMQRDDQWMVNYYWRIAEEAAKRHLIVDFHGSYKPSGLRRAYPNVLTREGVRGLEQSKWSDFPKPEYNLTIPFIRMLAGPMDYTPGAMINAQEHNFKSIFTRPMSIGTRCHQLAMYVVFESPLQMLCDSPSNYLREPECMEFLSQVPSVWDETVALDAKVAEYILIARRSGQEWYVGAMTDENARELILDLSFLDQGSYNVEIYRDGINADRHGNDYKKEVRRISNSEILTLKLAPGGGWAARIYK